jgi:hypothetical protein
MTTSVDHLSNSVSRQLSDYELDGDRGFLQGSNFIQMTECLVGSVLDCHFLRYRATAGLTPTFFPCSHK